MPSTVNIAEVVLAAAGLITTIYAAINYYNALKDMWFIRKEKINGEIYTATNDTLREAFVLGTIAVALDVIIGVALFSYDPDNSRQNVPQRIANALALLWMYGVVMYGALAAHYSRVYSIRSYQLPGETRQEAWLRAKNRLRREGDRRTGVADRRQEEIHPNHQG